MSVPKRLQAVWDDIPDTGCKGLCVASCGPVSGSEVELALIAGRGVHIDGDLANVLFEFVKGNEPRSCPALVAGRCSVYDVRPTVCRLWGAVEDMPCPWGCVPEGGRLTHEEGHELLARSLGA